MKPCSKCGVLHNRRRTGRRKNQFQAYCALCHAAYMRATRPRHRDLSTEARWKSNARAYANTYQKRGKLVPQPCHCGAKAEKHHHDYSKPLEVEWLCRKHHLEIHPAT